MSHSKSVGHINKISKVTTKLFELTMFRLVPHCPVAYQRPITIESKDQSINKAYNIMHNSTHMHTGYYAADTLTGASIEACEQYSASWG